MPKIGVVLSGCGVKDGSEIHEATLTLLFLDELGVEIVCMAPDTDNIEVLDHASLSATGETRNVLSESARIARGDILDIAKVGPEELDGLIFPGGLGAVKNLCDWAAKGPDCSVNADVERLLLSMRAQNKPLAFICIAPVIAAKVFGGDKVKVTIGNDPGTAALIESTGARHENRAVDEIAVDDEMLIVSTPAYMLGPSIHPVSLGIRKLVAQVVAWAEG